MQFVFSGLLLSRHRELCRILIHTVYLLSKHTAINRTEFNSRRSIYPSSLQNAQVLLLLKQLKSS